MKLSDSIEELKKSSVVKKIYGSLGATINGAQTVEIPDREGFVYVRLRDSRNEIIQASNSSVSPVYDLPVVLVREGNRYKIEGRDTQRYQSWGSDSSFIPRHGDQHSFNPEIGAGGDVVWVYGKQFMPMLTIPSGSLGSNNVLLSEYVIQNGSTGWIYSGGTGTSNLLNYKPTNGNAVMILVYVDQTTGNPGILVGSGSYFSNAITGSAAVVPYIPAVSNSNYLPAMAVRLTSGTSVIGWDNLYDVRQFYGGSGGENSVTGSLTGISVQDEGVPKGTGTVFNFVGPNVDVSVSGSVVRVFVTGSVGGSSLPTFITGSVPFANSDGILKENNPLFSFNEITDTLWIGQKYTPPNLTVSDFRLMARATGANSIAGIGILTAGTGTSGGNSSTINGYHSRGTFENPTPVGFDDSLLTIIGAGYDGFQWRNAGRIRIYANGVWITGTHTESRIDFEVTPSGSATRRVGAQLFGDSFNLPNSGTYNINGVPHTHNDSSASSDGWNAGTGVWSYSSGTRTQAYTNDPAAGSSIVLNMTNTTGFLVGDPVTVSSSAGSENARITAIVTNTSITVNALALNHTTTSPLVTLLEDTFVISINNDQTAILSVGMKVRYVQTTTKYGIITAVGPYSGGATLITVYHGTDYTLSNAAISSPYWSVAKAPFGFPLSPTKWTVSLTDTTRRTQPTPTQSVWYNPGSVAIAVPIGSWKLRWKACITANNAGTTVIGVYGTLSTTNNSASDTDLVAFCGIAGANGTLYTYGTVTITKVLSITSKTPYYANLKTESSGIDTIDYLNDLIGYALDLECAYL